jgi:iron complex outermembrane receptor protein
MVLLAGASLAALVTAPAMAADEAAAATPAADTGIADIVVTAEKREVNLQRAPLAISAIAGAQLSQRNMNELNDLNGYVPGLTIAKNQGSERVITIRGVGFETSSSGNAQPGVAFHIDGVYIAHPMALSQDLLDVDRVEVLRGPQGTVFGETSTGGAINVITKKPVIGEASGSASVSYGNYNYIKAEGVANIPINDTMAFRASVKYLYHDGYGYATAVPGTKRYDLDDASNLGYRASLIWEPSGNFTALLAGQGFNADHHAALQKNILDTEPRSRVVTQDFPGKYKIDTNMLYLTLTQNVADVARLTSVSSYQWLKKNQSTDNDRLANSFFYDNIDDWGDRSKTFTQELTLSSASGGTVDWTAGGFYLRQRASQTVLETVSPFAATVIYNGIPVRYQVDGPFQHTSAAGYGNVTGHVGDDLDLLAGVRYSWDKITAQPVRYFGQLGPSVPGQATSDAWTGKLGAQYRITPSNMIYITASRGYKPTGVSVNADFHPLRVPTSFKKEIVDALEIGSKNDLFDRKVRLNLSAYYYWYKNFQFSAEDPIAFAGGIDNAPRARIYGLESELTVLPFDGFRLDGTVSLAKGKFTRDFLTVDAQTAADIRNFQYANVVGFFNPFDPRVIAAVDAGRQNISGNRVPKLPRVQGQMGATYTTELAGGKLTLRGEVVYRGSFIYRIFNKGALDRVPAYTIFNSYIEYAPNDKPWKVSLAAQNLGNKDALNSRFSDPYGSGTTSVEYINPRQVFGTVSFQF